MPAPFSPKPLEAVIAATVALDDALGQLKFPQARHHARVVALRAQGAALLEIGEAAHAVMDALNQAVRPERALWAAPLKALHRAIDQALDDTGIPPA